MIPAVRFTTGVAALGLLAGALLGPAPAQRPELLPELAQPAAEPSAAAEDGKAEKGGAGKPDAAGTGKGTEKAAKEGGDKKGEKEKADAEPGSLWEKVPPVSPLPRLGLFTVPPAGPGYYSVFDCLHGSWREKPPVYPYPRFSLIAWPFYDYSFAYLEKPDNVEHDFFDPIKRIHWGDDCLVSLGGELRYRYVNEVHARLSGRDNTYGLLRTRLFGDFWYLDRVRLFVEYLDAQTYHEDLDPLPIDVNHSDLLNCFADLKVCETCKGPVYFRLGRQELAYGSQRLISPLDWANTRRTFQGVKLFLRGEKFDADLFCTQPVVPDAGRFDSVDNDQVFTGAWATYRPAAGRFVDVYYLNLDQARHVAEGRGGERGGFNVSTLGARSIGDAGNWLWDFEAMVQFGGWSNQTQFAQAYTVGGGYCLKDCPLMPQLWVYYDFASGDPDPGEGNVHRTFLQLFPFGHYYLGYIDVVARQNIHDINTQLALYPAKWLTAILQFHVFRLDSPRDALYNAAGVPVRRDPSGQAGTEVGQELDLLFNLHLSTHQDVLIGYSHFYPGDFLRQTGSARSADYFYMQYSYRW